MRGLGRIAAALGAGIAGLGAAVFFHPRSGARNRRVAAGVARRRSASVAAIVGASVVATSGRGGRREEQLAGSVRAALESRHGADAGAIHVGVHRSTVTLRGEVVNLDDIEAYEVTARAVAGVSDVNNLLRLAASASAAR